jgi:hypothetical protein
MCRLRAPLIFFWIVKRYRPERVRRQFGFRQLIPPEITERDKIADKDLHKIKNGRGDNWPKKHAVWRLRWDDNYDERETDEDREPFNPDDVETYMRWYWANSDPLVQTTITHGSSVYRPTVPDKRLAVLYYLFIYSFYYSFIYLFYYLFYYLRQKQRLRELA